MNRRVVASLPRVLQERLLLWTLAVVFAMTLATPVRGAGNAVDSIVVKFQDGVVAASTGSVPMEAMSRLLLAIGAPFAITGQTRDGAFTLQLSAPLDQDAARAALNAIRLERSVLYANLAPGAPTPATTGLPTNKIIVKYRDPALTANARAGMPLDQGQLVRLTGLAGQPLAWLRGGHDGSNVLSMLQRLPIAQVEAIAARIAQEADVDYAQPDYIRTAQIVPTDPCYASSMSGCAGGYQWDLFDPVGGINMPAAWDITTGSASINVAVIDTGALLNHPDLAGRFVGGYDMIADCAVANDGQPGPCTWSSQTPNMLSRDSDAADPGDWVTAAENIGNGSAPPYFWFQGCGAGSSSFHGTHVAGTIGAVPNNGMGIAGINWVSKIVPVRVLGKCGGYTSDIVAAIVWAAGGSVSGIPANANPARVLSISLGGGGSCSPAEQSAINTALALGAVVAVAAGNENDNAASHSPASCSGVITVAATNKAGRKSWYSNWGASVEIAAPGGSADGSDTDILSTLNSGATSPSPTGYNYANYAGTSMATPHVSGVASLMLSVNPALTPAQVLSKIQTTARVFPTPGPACTNPPGNVACNCTTALCGAGIINAAAAVAASSPGVPTTTTLTSLPNSSTVGGSVTFTATINGGSSPTGTVNFKDGASSISGCGTQAVSGAQAQCTTSALILGTHSITAAYSGDTNNSGSTSSALTQTVNGGGPVATSTALASSPNPANAGVSVTFTATVTGSGPAGTVNFKDGANSIAGCNAKPITTTKGSGTATCTTAALSAGVRSITAVYSGDAGTLTSTSPPLSQTINGAGPVPTTMALGSVPNPSTVGASVTFTATVNGGNSPTGTVNFKDGASSIASCNAQPVSAAQAQCVTSGLTQGAHSVTAVYSGDPGNQGSTSPAITQTVNASGPTPTSTALGSVPNPSTVGASVTFTASITGSSPTGTVNFKDGVNSIASCNAQPVSAAQAQCVTSGLTQGAHSITAVYSGDPGNQGSTSPALTQTINTSGGGLPTVTALASSPNPSAFGASVTFTASITGGNSPTGTVNFKDGASSIVGCGAQPLATNKSGVTATCITTALAAGSHSVTATYNGDAGNQASTSPPLAQTVNGGGAVASTTIVVSSQPTAAAGTPVTFTATVTGIAPTGSVNFKDGVNSIAGCATQALGGGGNSPTALCTTSSLAVGKHSITAVYGGNAGNQPSTSAGITQSIQ